jgi:hypothetical protein
MKRFSAAARRLSLCGVLLLPAACQAPPEQPGGGDAAAGGQEPGPTASGAFRAWAAALPERTTLPAMTGTMNFAAQGDAAQFAGGSFDPDDLPVGADTGFAMGFAGDIEMESWTRMRARFDLRMELGPLKAQDERPVEIGVLIVADGETVWIEPDWSRAWFLEELEGQATGFERLVFSVQASTVREFLDVAAGAMSGEAAEWYRNSIECASNPACLARLIAEHADAESFAHDGSRVTADLVMDIAAWLPPEMLEMPGALSVWDEPFRYRCEFDAATGAVLKTEYEMAMGGGAMSMSMTQAMQPAARPFAADAFRYEVPPGRQAFPLDLFLKPILASIQLETGQAPTDSSAGDLPF